MRSISELTAGVAVLVAATVAAPALGHGEECRHGKLEMLSLLAESDKAWDPETGRDLRHFPPDRVIDIIHMKLDMRFEDLNDRSFVATETLRFVPIAEPVSELTLDAVGLDVDSVRLGQRPVEYFQDDDRLTVLIDPPVPPGNERELVMAYSCERPYRGMIFTPFSPEAPHYTAEMHTQGQTDQNRHWFICHDFPNERFTTELIVNVPKQYQVCSNGKLVSRLEARERANWHWLQDKPHVSYLVSLIIGEFDRVKLPHDRVSMEVWVPKGMADRVLPTYGRTGEMIDVFERCFGVPYPWDRYDQILVKNFDAGGMENTSVTSMYSTAILDDTAIADRDLESLIAHEAAHQWTGDLLTCKSWEHIWLNEGWASYGEALWFEHRDGQTGYLNDMRSAFRVANRDRTTNELGMVSPIYRQPFEAFRRPANAYSKGQSILHMLRRMLGDELFFQGVHLYMQRHQLGVVETEDFRYALEEVSGRGLEWFFDQWCYRPGSPRLDVDIDVDPAERRVHVRIEQTQEIDARTPAFRFTLPVHVITSDGSEVLAIEVDSRTTSFHAEVGGIPTVVAVDPHLHVLKKMTVKKPRSLWMTQVSGGPTIVARHQAVEALGEIDSPRTVRMLERLIRDESEPYQLRETAVAALRGYASDEGRAALLKLLQDGVGHPRVRDDIANAGRVLDKDTVVPVLATVAGNDASYKTRVAAIDSLAAVEAKDQAELLAELTHFPSQHEDVRRAALNALADLDIEAGLDLAIRYAAYGEPNRARATAVRAIGKLAKHDLDRAVPLLIALLDDPERRTRAAAAQALVDAGDERGLTPLRAIAESDPDPRRRERAGRQVAELQKKIDS